VLRKVWQYGVIGSFILIVLGFSCLQQSFAHPVYMDSSPKAFQSVPSSPGQVNVFFSEPIELDYSSISVLGPDGSTVDLKDPHNVEGDTASIGVTLQPNLPEGEYTVTTNVLSAVDGHVIQETFTLVLEPLCSNKMVQAANNNNSRETFCRQKNQFQGFLAWSAK
jgi:methionine-rich copper-binding protein CopC